MPGQDEERLYLTLQVGIRCKEVLLSSGEEPDQHGGRHLYKTNWAEEKDGVSGQVADRLFLALQVGVGDKEVLLPEGEERS